MTNEAHRDTHASGGGEFPSIKQIVEIKTTMEELYEIEAKIQQQINRFTDYKNDVEASIESIKELKYNGNIPSMTAVTTVGHLHVTLKRYNEVLNRLYAAQQQITSIDSKGVTY